jgi:hypothetical protein
MQRKANAAAKSFLNLNVKLVGRAVPCPPFAISKNRRARSDAPYPMSGKIIFEFE